MDRFVNIECQVSWNVVYHNRRSSINTLNNLCNLKIFYFLSIFYHLCKLPCCTWFTWNNARCTFFSSYFAWNTGNRRQLCLPPIIWNVSHFTIFPLELLGPAIGFLADPSSSKEKNHELSHNNKFFQQQTNVLVRCVVMVSNKIDFCVTDAVRIGNSSCCCT